LADEVKKTPAEEAAEHIIPESALVGKGVSAQPNPMELPEDQAKAVFDQISKEIIIPAYNAFVQFVAAKLGLIDTTKDMDKPISTATQAALDDKHDKELRTGSETEYRVLTDNNLTDELKRQLESAYKKEHEHSNKALLDGLKQADIDNWNGGNVLTKDNTKAYEPTLPYHPATVKYVADTVKEVGAADMTKAVYDPQNKNRDIFKYADDAVKDAKGALDTDIKNIKSSLPMDFENQMAWKGCTYSYTKADNTYTEQWKKDDILRAEKISTRDADGNWTEIYKKYENGVKTEQVAVRSVKNADGGWTITVTEEVA
jgi:hypothetical protein